MRVAIVGAGAMGSLVAGLLRVSPFLSANDEIWLVGAESTKAHLAAMATDGLRFEVRPNVAALLSPLMLARLQNPVHDVHLIQDPALAYPCDLAIVLVKSYRTAQAGQQVAHLLASGGLVLSLQNGLGNVEMLVAHVTDNTAQVTQGTSLLGASLAQPGHVVIGGLGSTTLGSTLALTMAQQQTLEWFKQGLTQVGAVVNITDNVQSIIWGKLVVNCAVNPIAALLDVTNGTLLEYAATRQLLSQVALEVAAVARAAHIKLPFLDAQAPAQAMQAAQINADNICSMVQDLRLHRPTEIEAINGAVVREAARLGLDVPVNRTLTELIRVREKLAGAF